MSEPKVKEWTPDELADLPGKELRDEAIQEWLDAIHRDKPSMDAFLTYLREETRKAFDAGDKELLPSSQSMADGLGICKTNIVSLLRKAKREGLVREVRFGSYIRYAAI